MTTAMQVIPLSACKIIGTDTEANEREGVQYSDVTGGSIRQNPHFAQVTVRNGSGCASRTLNDGDIAMIDTSISGVNADGCIWLFEYDSRVLIRELQIMLTTDCQYRAVTDGEIFKGDQMQVIGRVVGIYTPFSSSSVQY